jgi:hypothetical protein
VVNIIGRLGGAHKPYIIDTNEGVDITIIDICAVSNEGSMIGRSGGAYIASIIGKDVGVYITIIMDISEGCHVVSIIDR